MDKILCETFPHAGGALIAVEEAVSTGLDTWVALTAGPDGSLMTPNAMGAAARDGPRRMLRDNPGVPT